MREEKALASPCISEDTYDSSFLDTSIHVPCVCEKRRLWRVRALAKTRMILRFLTLQYMYLVYARREDSGLKTDWSDDLGFKLRHPMNLL